MKKLLVVTAGTVAASVGQELMRQVKARPASELQVLVCSPAYQHYEFPDNDGYQSHVQDILPGHVQWIDVPGVEASSIQHDRTETSAVSRDQIKRWLSDNVSSLSHGTKEDTTLSLALIISSVGATSSGSLQQIVELMTDAASEAEIKTPTFYDIFMMLSEPIRIDNSDLATIYELFAERGAARLAHKHTIPKNAQGRIILVGWGEALGSRSITQLEEATATLVRLVNDPITGFAGSYKDSLADYHSLRQLDEVTLLPAHLSSVTAVTIGLSNLEEQIIERNTTSLIAHLVSDNDRCKQTPHVFTDILDHTLFEEAAEDHYAFRLDNRVTFTASSQVAVEQKQEEGESCQVVWYNKQLAEYEQVLHTESLFEQEKSLDKGDPSTVLAECLIRPFIEKALMQLSWVERNCLLLHIDARFPLDEIAEIMNLDKEQAREALEQGRKRLLRAYYRYLEQGQILPPGQLRTPTESDNARIADLLRSIPRVELGGLRRFSLGGRGGNNEPEPGSVREKPYLKLQVEVLLPDRLSELEPESIAPVVKETLERVLRELRVDAKVILHSGNQETRRRNRYEDVPVPTPQRPVRVRAVEMNS